jgi:hypothetical protein
MIEWGLENQEELMIIARKEGACLFGDQSGFWRPELEEELKAVNRQPAFAVDILGPIIASKRAITLNQYCLLHKSNK